MDDKNETRATRCIILGAGIAGTVAALALLRHGFDVVLLEQVAEKREVGAGIQLSSNAVKVLQALGLEQAIAPRSIAAGGQTFRELRTGEQLLHLPLGEDASQRYGAGFYQAHRADVLDVLAAALPEGVLRAKSRGVAFDQDENGVAVTLESGEVVTGDALVGADGIHSSVRNHLFGMEDPAFTNVLMWRAIIPRERVEHLGLDPIFHGWTGEGRAAICYWIRDGELLNFVGMVPATEVQRESWSQSGDVSDLRKSYAGSDAVLQEIINAIDSAFITGLFYRDPLPRWSEGRITLMGDAAHAMVPYLAQGACQAIEDAWTLAESLAGEADIAKALRDYEQRRRPRTTKVQIASRGMAKAMHESDPIQIAARNGRWNGLASIDPLFQTVWGWVYDHDPVVAARHPASIMPGTGASFMDNSMDRPEAKRAFELWRDAFSAEDQALGIPGLRAAYDRFMGDTLGQRVASAVSVDGGAIKGIWPTGEPSADDPVLLYLHGGHYVMGSAETSAGVAQRIAQAAGAKALVLDYPLAPEHPFPAALENLLAALEWLEGRGVAARRILVAGDGAGAGLAVAATAARRDAGKPPPRGLVLFSPFIDLAVSDPALPDLGKQDPALDYERLVSFASCYIQNGDPADPAMSPLRGNFTGFPPMMIEAAENESLRRDAERLAEAARADGAAVSLMLHPDSVHAFHYFSDLPEALDAMDRVRAFSDRHMAAVPA
jgi:salicylate hydroxylase